MEVVNQELFEVQEASRAENQKLMAESRKDSEQRIERMQGVIMVKMKSREQQFLLKLEKKLEATTEKLQEIREPFSKIVTSIEEKVSNFGKTVAGKLVITEEKINKLQSQRPEPGRLYRKVPTG